MLISFFKWKESIVINTFFVKDLEEYLFTISM